MPKAAVARGLNEPLSIEEIDLEAPRAGEVKVKMGASGVCHSDLSVVNGTLFGVYPIVLGHEGAGVIEEVGEGVTDLAPGDHVVISWVPQCGECFFCKKGQGYLCEAGAMAMATGGLLDGTTRFSKDGAPLMQMACSGTFSDTAVIPAIGAVKIPDDIPLEIAALIGCGVLTGVGAATNTADIKQGDTVVVIGCGGVGLNVIQGAVHRRRRASHRRRHDREQAEDGRAVRRHRSRRCQRGRRPRQGDGADRPARRRRRLRGDRPEADDRSDHRHDPPRRRGRARRRPEDGGHARAAGLLRCGPHGEDDQGLLVRLVATCRKTCRSSSAGTAKGKLKLDELISRRIDLEDVNDAFRAMEAGEVARTVINY